LICVCTAATPRDTSLRDAIGVEEAAIAHADLLLEAVLLEELALGRAGTAKDVTAVSAVVLCTAVDKTRQDETIIELNS